MSNNKIKGMLKEKFTASEKVLTMKEGRTNFAEATKEFLEQAELINKGTGELSDIVAKYKDKLASAENGLAVYLKGSVIDSKEVEIRQAVIAKLAADRKEAQKAVREYMPKMTDADKRLYVAYYWYQTEPEKESYQGEFEALYKRAFMEWFDSFGMTMGSKDWKFFATKLGLKKASNKAYRESNAKKLTKELAHREFIELLYRIIIELMIKKGIIKNYEFTYTTQVQGNESVEKPEATPVEEKQA